MTDPKNVFVVHGQDEAARLSVEKFLRQLELSPIVLQDQPNRSRTILEKFEAHADVHFAVVLLTPDDQGASSREIGLAAASRRRLQSVLKPRARQNVILELGYFLGKGKRKRVCALYKEGVELPSDLLGVTYVPFDDYGAWRQELAREIDAAGIPFEGSRVFRSV